MLQEIMLYHLMTMDRLTLIEKLEEGYDVVYAYYKEVKQNLFRIMGSHVAGMMGRFCLGIPKDFKASSFYVARKYIIDEMLNYKNAYPYLIGLVFRATRNIASVETEHRSRLVGTSGYSFRSLLSLNCWIYLYNFYSNQKDNASRDSGRLEFHDSYSAYYEWSYYGNARTNR